MQIRCNKGSGAKMHKCLAGRSRIVFTPVSFSSNVYVMYKIIYIYFWLRFVFVYHKSLKRSLKPDFEYKITFWTCVIMLWIHKVYFVVKKLMWNARIKAFWYTKDILPQKLKRIIPNSTLKESCPQQIIKKKCKKVLYLHFILFFWWISLSTRKIKDK